MTDTYTPPPAKTMDDIDKVIDFIKARVTPLRNDAEYGSDQERAFQALLDVTDVLRGSAQEEIRRGGSATMSHFYLVTAGRQWSKHPEFLPEWKN